jgi:RNA polymerase sigma factor (sigma-70 family)
MWQDLPVVSGIVLLLLGMTHTRIGMASAETDPRSPKEAAGITPTVFVEQQTDCMAISDIKSALASVLRDREESRHMIVTVVVSPTLDGAMAVLRAIGRETGEIHLERTLSIAPEECADAHLVLKVMLEQFLTDFPIEKWKEREAEAAPWLYGIAANLCRRFGRSRKRRARLVSHFSQQAKIQEKVEGPERAMIREEEIQTVHRAIQKLPFKQREVFVLYELEGLEGREIGALLNLKENTVWTRLHYARKSFVTAVRKMVSYDE